MLGDLSGELYPGDFVHFRGWVAKVGLGWVAFGSQEMDLCICLIQLLASSLRSFV